MLIWICVQASQHGTFSPFENITQEFLSQQKKRSRCVELTNPHEQSLAI